jgi:ABC-type multidrug transport system fused ATPase/permease subunit
MERNSDETKKNDAQILAQLRRRPASTNRPQPEENAFWFEEPSVAAPRPAPASLAPSSETVDSSTDVASRSEALRRLVAGGAPKEPMSALSPTLRNLREELNAPDAATFATDFDDNADFSDDATLDYLESTLDASQRRESNAEEDATVATLGEIAQETEEAVESIDFNEENDETDVLRGEESFVSAENSETAAENASLEPSTSRIVLLESEFDPRQASKEPISTASDLMVVSNLKKGYVKAKKLIPVLQGVDLTARQGELLAIVGQSGSGKSTLLHLMGTLDSPDSGTIHFDGQRIDNLSAA